jgi:hypothetical protein
MQIKYSCNCCLFTIVQIAQKCVPEILHERLNKKKPIKWRR